MASPLDDMSLKITVRGARKPAKRALSFAHGEPAVGKNEAEGVLIPATGDIGS